MSTIWTFDHIENNHSLYRGEDCMKKFCTLREHGKNVIYFEKKKMLQLTKKELRLHQDVMKCKFVGKNHRKAR